MKTRIMMAMGLLFGSALFNSTAVQAQGWGDLTAKFVLDGDIPKPKALVITKDQEVCGKHNLVDEQLVVNPTNKAIANIAVYLYVATRPRPGKKPPIHESYKKTEKDEVVLNNLGCRFEPHVVALRTTQSLVAGNKDPGIGHNTNITTLSQPGQNILIPAAANVKFNFTVDEALPVKISCSIHPWMTASIVIKDHPYVAISDKDGKITIKNVPAGKWPFQFYQEAAGFVVDVKQNGKATKWERGRTEIDIKDGMTTDLGEIKVAPSSFKLN